MHEFLTIACPIIMTSIMGLFVWLVQRKINKQDKAREKREKEQERIRVEREEKKEKAYLARAEARKKESLLLLKAIDAIGKFALANSIAVRGGKINGEMKSALESYKESSTKLESFFREEAIKSYTN